MHRWTYIFWNLVHELDYGPSSRSLILFVVFTLTFSNSGISPCSLESCSQARPQTVEVFTVHVSVRGLHFNFLKCGFQNSSIVIILYYNLNGPLNGPRTVKIAMSYYYFSFLSHSSCVINKHIKSYQIHSILVLVPCF